MAKADGGPSVPDDKTRPFTYRSFNNLVTLANAQERLNVGLESSKKLVWRDAGLPPVVLETLLDCLDHSAIGGLRAAALAYGIRSGISLFILAFSILRAPKRFRLSLIRHALFGQEPARFGAMLGTFTALYKFLLNALPILVHRWKERQASLNATPFGTDSPLGSPDDDAPLEMRRRPSKGAAETQPVSTPSRPHLSSSTQASLFFARERGFAFEPWHATVAGSAAAAVAILFERPSGRLAVGQQMFVRGLQGLYNAWSRKTGIVVPFGSVVVFWLCCGQILYSFLLRPHTLSPMYDAWIQSMSVAPLEAIKMNRSLVFTGAFDTSLLETIVEGRSKPWKNTRPLITPSSRMSMLSQLELARQGIFGPQVISCDALHPHRDDCIPNILWKIVECTRILIPVYGALHLIPALLFRRKAMFKRPLHSLFKVIFGTMRSSTFIGVFVAILQAGFCALRNLHSDKLPPACNALARRLASSHLYWWLFSSLSGLSILIEDKHRREELAMYVLPKAGESAWITFREVCLGIKTRRKDAWKADVALSSVGMGMVMTIYQSNPAALSGLVRRVLYQFVGPN